MGSRLTVFSKLLIVLALISIAYALTKQCTTESITDRNIPYDKYDGIIVTDEYGNKLVIVRKDYECYIIRPVKD